MEKRATTIWSYIKGAKKVPSNTMLVATQTNLRRSSRISAQKHPLELPLLTTTLKTAEDGSLNAAKRVWSNLPQDVVMLWNFTQFKNAVNRSTSHLPIEMP
uniref:Uncharacterized protein n=1 Tax=Acrobeloides nanus TaxID=290746 RepID=A0A914CTF0_9BILA